MLVNGIVGKVPNYGKQTQSEIETQKRLQTQTGPSPDVQDMDIYFYDAVPSEMYLKPASFKGKKEQPNKWITQSLRSPFQKAFEIAMLKFNVGLGKYIF